MIKIKGKYYLDKQIDIVEEKLQFVDEKYKDCIRENLIEQLLPYPKHLANIIENPCLPLF